MKISEYLQTCIKDGMFPGASWVIGKSDKILETGGVGLLAPQLDPVTENSIYDMASVTKMFVTMAVMKQFEEGLIRLEDRVDYFLPSWKFCPLGEITIFSLMTHTSPLAINNFYQRIHSYDDIVEAIRTGKTRDDYKEKVLYTCENYILLGAIVSAIDKASLDEVIRRRVIEPLNMKDTGYLPEKELLPRIAPTEYCTWRKRFIRGEVHDENAAAIGGVSGNAGIFSSASDMAHMGAALVGSVEKGVFLHRATMQIMTRNYTAGMGVNRGLGFMIAGPDTSAGDLFSPSSFGHTGFTGTSLWVDPQRKLYAVLLTNRVFPTRNNEGVLRTRQIFHNLAVLKYCEA